MTKSSFKGAVIRWIRTIGMCLVILEVMKVDVGRRTVSGVENWWVGDEQEEEHLKDEGDQSGAEKIAFESRPNRARSQFLRITLKAS